MATRLTTNCGHTDGRQERARNDGDGAVGPFLDWLEAPDAVGAEERRCPPFLSAALQLLHLRLAAEADVGRAVSGAFLRAQPSWVGAYVLSLPESFPSMPG